MYRALTSFVMNKEIYAEEDIKKGQILPSDFVSSNVINDLLNSNYIEVYDSSLDITENGTYDVTDYEQANVNVSSTPILQSKEITITENGSTNITPDIGYDGLGRVDVTTNVSSGADLSEYFNTSITGIYTDNTLANCLYTKLLKKIPFFEVPNTFTNLSYCFCGFKGTEIPLIDTSNITYLESFCSACDNLLAIPLFNTSKVTNFSFAFSQCKSVETIPLLDTSNGTNFSNMFSNCHSLKNLPLLNLSKATNLNSVFNNCYNLTDESLDNILQMCINATSYTGTKTLARLGFNNNYYPVSRIEALAHYQDFINAGWTIGY